MALQTNYPETSTGKNRGGFEMIDGDGRSSILQVAKHYVRSNLVRPSTSTDAWTSSITRFGRCSRMTRPNPTNPQDKLTDGWPRSRRCCETWDHKTIFQRSQDPK